MYLKDYVNARVHALGVRKWDSTIMCPLNNQSELPDPQRWSKDLESGDPVIDWQHKELLRRFEKLEEALKEGSGQEMIVNLVAFLHRYALTQNARARFRQRLRRLPRQDRTTLFTAYLNRRSRLRKFPTLEKRFQELAPHGGLFIAEVQT